MNMNMNMMSIISMSTRMGRCQRVSMHICTLMSLRRTTMSISQISIISTNTNTDVQIQRADTRELNRTGFGGG